MEYLQEKNIRVEDMGAYEYNAEDDYPDFSMKVAKAVLQKPEEFYGIVICGSGVGVSIAANRFKGIRCVLGFDPEQVKHARENDHVNVLAIASEYADFEEAKAMIDAFLEGQPIMKDKYLRRAKKLDA